MSRYRAGHLFESFIAELFRHYCSLPGRGQGVSLSSSVVIPSYYDEIMHLQGVRMNNLSRSVSYSLMRHGFITVTLTTARTNLSCGEVSSDC